jgi:hypothetical protein
MLCLSISGAAEAGRPAGPETWLFPPTASANPKLGDVRLLRELFAKPEQWKNARSMLHVLGLADWQLAGLNDQELRNWLHTIQPWKLKLALETGFLNDSAVDARHAIPVIEKAVARLHKLGGRLDYLVLAGTRENAYRFLHKDQDFAAEQCTSLLADLNRQYPDLMVGDCEAYPGEGLDLAAWVGAVQAKAKEKKTRGLDFVQISVDWYMFLFCGERAEYSWPKVKRIEDAVRARQVLFGMRYAPTNVTHLEGKYNPNDLAWSIGLMRQGYDYFYVHGDPDQIVIACWDGAPARAVPETEDGTLTKSLDDFCNTFYRLGGAPIWVKSK